LSRIGRSSGCVWSSSRYAHRRPKVDAQAHYRRSRKTSTSPGNWAARACTAVPVAAVGRAGKWSGQECGGRRRAHWRVVRAMGAARSKQPGKFRNGLALPSSLQSSRTAWPGPRSVRKRADTAKSQVRPGSHGRSVAICRLNARFGIGTVRRSSQRTMQWPNGSRPFAMAPNRVRHHRTPGTGPTVLSAS